MVGGLSLEGKEGLKASFLRDTLGGTVGEHKGLGRGRDRLDGSQAQSWFWTLVVSVLFVG